MKSPMVVVRVIDYEKINETTIEHTVGTTPEGNLFYGCTTSRIRLTQHNNLNNKNENQGTIVEIFS